MVLTRFCWVPFRWLLMLAMRCRLVSAVTKLQPGLQACLLCFG